MQNKAIGLLVVIVLCLPAFLTFAAEQEDLAAFLTRKIPQRHSMAMTGTEFAQNILGLHGTQREQLILGQLKAGNLPDFLKILAPVHLAHRSADGRTTTVTIFAIPDYLAIGSDRDFIRIPMGLHAAAVIAEQFGFILPTARIVDAIFHRTLCRLRPEPMQAGPAMRSTAYYLRHNQKIGNQCLALGYPLGELISGHKKDVVMTNLLAKRQSRVAIYGWHLPSGIPIQPLSTIHGANYADYSHGIRLISNMALLNGELCSIWRILEDPMLAGILNDEGPMSRSQFMTLSRRQTVRAHISSATSMEKCFN
jgi:hypothetical protein